MRMMQKMGYTEGKGLGKNEDGRKEHIKVKKKDDKLGIDSKGYEWGNEWWADAYNSALGKKKKKKKMKKNDGNDSDSSDSSGSTASGSDSESDDEFKSKAQSDSTAAPGIVSQQAHLFAVGLSHHPDAKKTQGAGFVKGATVIGDEVVEEENVGGLGLGAEETKTKKRKMRNEETDKKELERAQGRCAQQKGNFHGITLGTGKQARLDRIEQVFKEKGEQAAKKQMLEMKVSKKGPRRSPRLQALGAPTAPAAAEAGDSGLQSTVRDAVVQILGSEEEGIKVKKLRKQVQAALSGSDKGAVKEAFQAVLEDGDVKVEGDLVTISKKAKKEKKAKKVKKAKTDETDDEGDSAPAKKKAKKMKTGETTESVKKEKKKKKKDK